MSLNSAQLALFTGHETVATKKADLLQVLTDYTSDANNRACPILKAKVLAAKAQAEAIDLSEIEDYFSDGGTEFASVS